MLFKDACNTIENNHNFRKTITDKQSLHKELLGYIIDEYGFSKYKNKQTAIAISLYDETTNSIDMKKLKISAVYQIHWAHFGLKETNSKAAEWFVDESMVIVVKANGETDLYYASDLLNGNLENKLTHLTVKDFLSGTNYNSAKSDPLFTIQSTPSETPFNVNQKSNIELDNKYLGSEINEEEEEEEKEKNNSLN